MIISNEGPKLCNMCIQWVISPFVGVNECCNVCSDVTLTNYCSRLSPSHLHLLRSQDLCCCSCVHLLRLHTYSRYVCFVEIGSDPLFEVQVRASGECGGSIWHLTSHLISPIRTQHQFVLMQSNSRLASSGTPGSWNINFLTHHLLPSHPSLAADLSSFTRFTFLN